MGAVLLASGTKGKRFALPHARILIHQPSMSGLGGQASDIDLAAKEILRMRERINEILVLHTGQDIKRIQGVEHRARLHHVGRPGQRIRVQRRRHSQVGLRGGVLTRRLQLLRAPTVAIARTSAHRPLSEASLRAVARVSHYILFDAELGRTSAARHPRSDPRENAAPSQQHRRPVLLRPRGRQPPQTCGLLRLCWRGPHMSRRVGRSNKALARFRR